MRREGSALDTLSPMPSSASSASTPPSAAAPLPHVPPLAISQAVGDAAAGRGLEYSRQKRVISLDWDRAAGRAEAEVEGMSDRYRVVVELREYEEDAVSRRFWRPTAGGIWRPTGSRCTCPVSRDCKHVAATLYALDARAEEQDREHPPSEWRSVLRPLLGEEAAEETTPQPLALRFDLAAAPLQGRGARIGREDVTAEHLASGSPLSLSMRPLIMGRKGSWIKGGISWRTFEYRVHSTAYDPAHAEALTRIFAAASAERSYAVGAIEQLWINQIGSPLLWQALAHARDVGVAFLPGSALTGLSLAGSAAVTVDLRSTGEDAPLVVQPLVTIDDVPAPHARPLGSAGIIDLDPERAEPAPKGDGVRLPARIAPAGSPIPTAMQRLFQRTSPLEVPPAEREEFLEVAYPHLRATTAVTSSDGSVEMPAVRPATLRLAAAYAEGDRLDLSWSWQYHDPSRTLPIDRRQGVRRDVEHEDAVLEAARSLWAQAGRDATEHLSGPDTAAFTEHVLDALGALDHVEARIVGTRHAYRELDGSPQVRVNQWPTPGKNDWFDLGFEITVDGRTIPFPTLFTALATGQGRLMLPDRTYFSLDNPVFDRLRELIGEGEALAEWNPHQQQISRYQVDMWEDITAIAEEARASAEWERSVGALARLTEITAPPLPAALTATLRPYQEEGFAWLAFLLEHGLGGVLADDMGLGKTVQTLALLAHARAKDPTAPPFLVVAPSSVLGVWRAEAERFTPSLKVVVVDRTARARGTDVSREILGADLVVTSYTVLRIDAEEFTALDFQALVLDEAQFVKNRRSRSHQVAAEIRASFRLAITGTPMENTLEDLWSILALATPGLFPSAIAFRQRYTAPIESGEHPERMEELRSRVRPFLLRRTKELVAKDLPPKHEQVLTVTLSEQHRALYDSILQRERKKVLGLIEEDLDRNRFIVFRSLTLLRMMALDPSIVDAEAHGDVASSKLEALFDRLDEVVDGHRVLLFSQFTSHLRHVADELDMRGIRYAYLDGSTKDRDAVVTTFREGDAPVFLISLKAGGFGLTLTEADYVFLLDPWWNPAAENQAVDRAHRIGQDRTVMVYRMVAEDTIEEKVLALQQRKAELFEALTEGGGAFARGISADDIRELLA
ncbi:DEAD/DEAH box helicase [Brachybacterium rhamnosum]